MLQLQPKLSVGRAACAVSVALAVNSVLVFLIYALTIGDVQLKREQPVFAAVYWTGPLEPRQEMPQEETPPASSAEALSSAPSPTLPTLNFEFPMDLPSSVSLPKFKIGQLETSVISAAPAFDFAEPVAQSAPTPNVSSTIKLAQPTFRVPPQYPMKAKHQGIEGSVVMDILVNVSGAVDEIRIVSETPEGIFARSARRAVNRWKFAPPQKPEWQRLTIRYELEK